MSQASQLSPELAQGLLQLARALLGAVRNWTLYPPEHPSVGRAVERLADADRRRRVLTMTRSMLSETDFGRSGQFQVLWTSMEELLVSYNEKPYVSESYRGALDGVGGRAERMAASDLPPELPAWMETLGQNSVRALSVTLLIDPLTLERDATRAAGIADDMEALAEDLLMSGAYDAGVTALARVIARRRFSGAGSCGASRSAAWVPWPGSGPPQRRLSWQMRRKPGTGCREKLRRP